MNCSVGIDISKGKSTICVLKPFGEVEKLPFDVPHTVSELSSLARMLLSLPGEVKAVMEATGSSPAGRSRAFVLRNICLCCKSNVDS